MNITASKPAMRTVLVVLAGVAGILACAIYTAAKSSARSRAEVDELAEAQRQIDETRKEAAQRIEALDQENFDLRKQLELVKADLEKRSAKLATTEQEVTRLRNDLDAA